MCVYPNGIFFKSCSYKVNNSHKEQYLEKLCNTENMSIVEMLLNTMVYTFKLWWAQNEDEDDLINCNLESQIESSDDVYEDKGRQRFPDY